MKKFRIPADQIRDVARGWGACIASDKITVEGHPVCWMYREESDDEVDSGWRFFSGEETDEYTSDSANLGLYEVNTIANYDPDIIPLLGAEVGNAYERAHGAQPFRKAADWTQPEDE